MAAKKPGPQTKKRDQVKRKSFTCTEKEWTQVNALAEKWDWSVAKVVRFAVQEMIRNEEN